MPPPLISTILDAALVQFGSFRPNGGSASDEIPVALHLEMLPSYPAALREAGERIAQLLGNVPQADRLLCSVDAVGLGAMVATSLGKPLVYQHDDVLTGAYDIGHPTALIVNDTGDLSAARTLIKAARQVGLNVIGIAALVGVRQTELLDGVPCWSAMSLSDIVSAAESERRIPPGHAERVRRWLLA